MAETMSTGVDDSPEPAPTPTHSTTQLPAKSKRKKNLLVFTLIVLAIAAVTLWLYVTQWRYQVSTEDAYVSGNQVQINAQISGTVTAIGVNDTDMVKAGQTLVALDQADNGLALETAKAQLRTAIRQYKTQTASIQQADVNISQAQTAMNEVQSQIESAKIALLAAQSDYQRRAALMASQAVSQEEVQHAADTVKKAQAQLDAAVAKQATARSAVVTAQAQRNVTVANLGKNDVLSQPAVQTAMANIQTAWLNLNRTQIVAPIDGQIAKRGVQLGQKISAGTPLMVIVPLHDLWVDANFKESQIKDIHLGQAVNLTSDIYGKEVVYHGKVIGLSAGTGSAFSVLPAQNATGNWIKVTQRLPVRIALDSKELQQHPLRVGLSMHAELDSRDQQGKPQVATATASNKPVAQLQPQVDMSGATKIIQQIIQQNQS
ncbi:efflux pump membrane protein [Enhydrobacter aerosaccus SK60]|nr:HlyD family efflux transporter periplasmic adaptor subunit [Moraxella sp. DOX410]EEV23737.1 efflux pump membrane protein [Enhydrobacter aerosaccus SK60]WNP28445.1 HlyD family efflux transporter periplasmic adaptor subunit [Moraxella sp. DOX410]